jgi:hypothetical protein
MNSPQKTIQVARSGGEIFESVDRPYWDEQDILWLERDALITSVEPSAPADDSVKLVLCMGCLVVYVFGRV